VDVGITYAVCELRSGRSVFDSLSILINGFHQNWLYKKQTGRTNIPAPLERTQSHPFIKPGAPLVDSVPFLLFFGETLKCKQIKGVEITSGKPTNQLI
jgi:hypothetical protein